MRAVLVSCLVVALAGVAYAADSIPKEGDKAPDVKLPAVGVTKYLPGRKNGDKISLSDFRGENGKNVVLFFYPKAMTRGCTIESCGFRDKADELAKLDTVIVGISTDNLEDQMKFTEKEKLNFPLFADPEKKAAKTFGVLNAKNGLAMRWTFIIDK